MGWSPVTINASGIQLHDVGTTGCCRIGYIRNGGPLCRRIALHDGRSHTRFANRPASTVEVKNPVVHLLTRSPDLARHVTARILKTLTTKRSSSIEPSPPSGDMPKEFSRNPRAGHLVSKIKTRHKAWRYKLKHPKWRASCGPPCHITFVASRL